MMNSHCIVPNWNLKHQQRQQQVEAAESEAEPEPEPEPEPNTSSHVNNNNSHLFPMSLSNYEVAELRWENGQLAKHGLGVGGPIPAKPTWVRSNDTLESIVHQATITACHNNNMNKEMTLNLLQHDHQNSQAKISSNMVASSGRKQVPVVPRKLEKRTRADSDQGGRNFSGMLEEKGDRSACASASATYSRDNNNDTTLMTWASYESPKSYKTKTTDEDSAFHDGSEKQDDDLETKTGRSHSSRRSRAAAIHNQSERRRRDRINQKLKTLQRLVPNASKTDKASMLDEVIDYLKQLQAQVQMMNNVRNNMPQMNMMMPLGMQQQLQMSLLARMGMGVGLGMGMGMLDMNSMAAAAAAARSAPQSLPPLIHTSAGTVSPFIVPPMIATCPPAQSNSDPGDTNNASSVHLPDPYCALLAQSMNVELYNKMAALFRQQVNQSTQQMATRSPSTQSNQMQGD